CRCNDPWTTQKEDLNAVNDNTQGTLWIRAGRVTGWRLGMDRSWTRTGTRPGAAAAAPTGGHRATQSGPGGHVGGPNQEPSDAGGEEERHTLAARLRERRRGYWLHTRDDHADHELRSVRPARWSATRVWSGRCDQVQRETGADHPQPADVHPDAQPAIEHHGQLDDARSVRRRAKLSCASGERR